MPTFRASLSPLSEHRCRLELVGEIDLAAADLIIELGRDALNQAPVDGLMIDLAHVTFMDSTALGALVALRNAAQATGKGLTLAHVPQRIGRILEMTGLAGIFDLEPEH
jgi:anti-anti-sigma factor